MSSQLQSGYSLADKVQRYAKAGTMLLRGLLLKFRFRHSGGMLLIGRGVRVRNPQYIHSFGRLIIEDYAELQGLSIEGLKFGKNVSVGSNASIRPSGYYGREKGLGLVIGDDSNIGSYCFVGCGGGVRIGSNVLIAPYVSIHSENHDLSSTDLDIKSQGVTRRRVTIEDNCWLATGSRIMAGVTVGSGSVVAAGAVVTRDVPRNSIVAGVPARVVRTRSSAE